VSLKETKYCTSSTSSSSNRKYLKKWEKDFTNWLEYDADCESAFFKLCKLYRKTSFEGIGGVWITKAIFTNWKKSVVKMKAHANSDTHVKANQAALAHLGLRHTGTIIQQVQNETELE